MPLLSNGWQFVGSQFKAREAVHCALSFVGEDVLAKQKRERDLESTYAAWLASREAME